MCSCPIEIPNPYAGCDPSKGYNYLHDCTSKYIQVPCGRCHECISSRQAQYSVRSSIEVAHSVPFMLTLTYDNNHVPRMDSQGDILDGFAYPDYRHLSLLFKRLRNKIERCPSFGKHFCEPEEFTLRHNGRKIIISPFKYLAVSEFGKVHFRPHFHVLLFVRVPKHLRIGQSIPFQAWCTTVEHLLHDFFRDNFTVNVSQKRGQPQYESLYTYVRSGKYCTFDFHRIVSVQNVDDSSPIYYVTKYLYKPNQAFDKFGKRVYYEYKQGRLSKERFDLFYRVTHRSCRTSNYFGYPLSDAEYECIQRSIQHSIRSKLPSPLYIMPDGSTSVFPQSYKKFISLDAATHFAYNITDKIPTLYECYIDFEHRKQGLDDVQKISERIKNYDSALDGLLGYDRCYDGFLWNDKSSSKESSPVCNDNDFGDYNESDLYNDRRTFKSYSETSGQECRDRHITEYQQLTLFDL